MHSGDVRSVTFPVTRFRDGYDQHEVDAFLERCAATLEALEGGNGERTVTAESIVRQRFSTTRFREGYDAESVDIFLDRIAVRLREA